MLSDGVVAYDLNTALFSDYALKLRTVWIPEGAGPAAYHDRECFEFPVGTVITKTFYYRDADGGVSAESSDESLPDAEGLDLSTMRVLETRVLAHREDGWVAFPYVWNAEETEARNKEEDSEESKRSLQENARERVKDKIVRLDDQEMEELLAGLLRAMGFKATVSPVGPDRGVDVIASPDGLGLQEPRIKAEVKHRKNTQIGSQDIRSFIGALRAGDRGIYLSTGGFTREAKYEAERSNIPLTLLDLDGFARLIETHYDNFDTEARTLLPLIKVLWPAD